MFSKHASNGGVSPWLLAVVANFIAAAMMSGFWGLGGEPIQASLLWQPLLIGLFYVFGQTLIICAISYGDVSVAMPVASVKVVIVAGLMVVFSTHPPSATTWTASILAALGVFFINLAAPHSQRRQILFTLVLALVGVTSFAAFDVCVQSWTPNWGTGRILPLSFWSAGILTLGMLPFVPELRATQRIAILSPGVTRSIGVSGLLIATQAMLLVYGLSAYAAQGDAAQMNVVYSLRGLWGVLLAWLFASRFGGAEAELPGAMMISRLFGAGLLVSGVILTILNI